MLVLQECIRRNEYAYVDFQHKIVPISLAVFMRNKSV